MRDAEPVEVAIAPPRAATSDPLLVPAARPSASTVEDADSKVGVPECDAYIATLERCLTKFPDAAAAAAESTRIMRAAWKDAARDPTARETLTTACKAAHEAILTGCNP